MSSMIELLDELRRLVVPRIYEVPIFSIPGITVASIYTSGDALGTSFSFQVPKSGRIMSVIYYDLDDEGSQVDVKLFRHDFTATADHDAFAPTDKDALKGECAISITNFANFGSNQIGIANDLNLDYVAPEGKLYGQCVTRGTPTIAAYNTPWLKFYIVNYEV